MRSEYHDDNLIIDSTCYFVNFRYTVLNLNGNLYIGGLPEELRGETPPQAWSARLREDFVGQLGSLSIDRVMLDLALESTARWAKGYIQPDDNDTLSSGDVCSKPENPCASGECIHDFLTESLCDRVQTNCTEIQCNEGKIYLISFSVYSPNYCKNATLSLHFIVDSLR